MRYIVTAIAVLWLTNAFAFDGQSVTTQYNHARPGCRQNELDGKPISQAESAKQCAILAKLGKELKQNGYCWSATEQEWAICK